MSGRGARGVVSRSNVRLPQDRRAAAPPHRASRSSCRSRFSRYSRSSAWTPLRRSTAFSGARRRAGGARRCEDGRKVCTAKSAAEEAGREAQARGQSPAACSTHTPLLEARSEIFSAGTAKRWTMASSSAEACCALSSVMPAGGWWRGQVGVRCVRDGYGACVYAACVCC